MALDKRNILSKQEKIRQFGEVFTPQKTVDQMCDLLEEQDGDAFTPEKTFLEPCCGEGVFVLEILRRKFRRCKARKDYTTAIMSVYAMELQADNVEKTIAAVTELCKATFRPTKEELEIIKDHVIQADSLKIMRMINDMNGREGQ
jgi:type I restriction-modification system DNA methylase subunit